MRNQAYEEAETIIQFLLKDTSPLERAATLMLLSGLYGRQHQHTSSQACSLEALQIYTDHNIPHARVQVMGNLGSEFCIHGNLQQGKEYLHAALTYNQKKDNRFGIALNNINLSTIFLMEHNAQKALNHSYMAVSLLQEVGNQPIKAIALINRGMAHVLADQLDDAKSCFVQSLEQLDNADWIAMTQLLCIMLRFKPLSDWEKNSNLLMSTSPLTEEEWKQIFAGMKIAHAIKKHRQNEDRREIRKAELGIRDILRNPSFSIPRQPVEKIPEGNVHHRYCILLLEHTMGPRYTKRFHAKDK